MKIDARNVIYLILEYVSEKNNSFDYQDMSDECWKHISQEQLDNLQKLLDGIFGLGCFENLELMKEGRNDRHINRKNKAVDS